MQKKYFIVSLLVLACLLSAFKAAEFKVIQALERVGITGDDVRDNIWMSLAGGGFSYPSVAGLKQVAADDRAGVAREIVAFAKSYAATEEFKAKYLEYRETHKPTPPEPPKSMAQQQKERQEAQAKNSKDMDAVLKALPPDQQAKLRQTMEAVQKQMQALEKQDNGQFNQKVDEMNRQAHEAAMQEYQQKLAKWQQDYPEENPRKMIKQWLTKFLDVSKDVDFNAKLKPGPGRKLLFDNPGYEAKSSEWKMCYRAGKEVVAAGRLAAQQWLGELK